MTLRCKPGDLAVIVKTHPECAATMGRPIRITTLSSREPDCWEYEEMPLRGRYPGGWFTWHSIPDDWLRPLRDPGEDAQDETLAWKPVPSETVPA